MCSQSYSFNTVAVSSANNFQLYVQLLCVKFCVLLLVMLMYPCNLRPWSLVDILPLYFFQEDFEEALNILRICQEDYHAAVKPSWFFFDLGHSVCGWMRVCEFVCVWACVCERVWGCVGVRLCACMHECIYLWYFNNNKFSILFLKICTCDLKDKQ